MSTDLTLHQEQEAALSPILEGTAAATQRATDLVSVLRPATVVSVNPSRDSVEVIDDANPSGSVTSGAMNICGCYLTVGDRVMVLYYPPHGAAVVGMRRGGYVPWTFADESLVDVVGGFGAGWANTGGTTGLDQDAIVRVSWKRNNGVAELQGRATRVSGGANIICWVPGGYRPRNDKVFASVSGAATFGVVGVRRNGQVIALNGNVDAGTGGYIILDGIHYSVD